MTETQRLIDDIEAFLEAHSMAHTTFGRLSCGDVHVVRRLRRGHTMTLKRAEAIRRFMSEYTEAA